MTGVDISGELHDLASAVEELEDQLEVTRSELEEAKKTIDTLRLANEELENQIVFSEAEEEVYELLADLKRGLITVDELIERTVGR